MKPRHLGLMIFVVLALLLLAVGAYFFQRPTPPRKSLSQQSPAASTQDAMQQAENAGHKNSDRRHAGDSASRKAVPEQWVRPPDGPAPEVIGRLKADFDNGDKKAGLFIFLKLDNCLTAINERTDEARMARLRRMNADIPAVLKDLEQRLDECKGLSESEYGERGKWLEAAADRGDEYAQSLYASYAEAIVGDASDMMRNPERVIEYKRKAMGFLQDQAARGSAKAWRTLSSVYDDGLLTPRDPVRAYAYFAADMMAAQEQGHPMSSFYPVQEHLVSRLSIEERKQGERLAKEIYQSCCSR